MLARNVNLNLTPKTGWMMQERGGNHLIDKMYVRSSSVVCVEHLDWQFFDESNAQELNVDIVIGADIVFDEEILPSLVKTIRLCLSVDGDASKERRAFVAGVVRNEKTSLAFVRFLKTQNLKVEINVLDQVPLVNLYCISL